MTTSVDHERTIRAAENQSLFREVNERVEQLHERFVLSQEVADWICECLDTACTRRIFMTLAEYESVRGDSNQFAVAPGHEVRDVEVVVDATERYVVVSKIGAGAERARQLDPRS